MARSTGPFRYFDSSPEVIRLVVLMYVRYPLSLRNVEDLLFERGIDICHETVRLWWNRFGPMFAADIRRKRVQQMRRHCQTKCTASPNLPHIKFSSPFPGAALSGEMHHSVIRRR